MTEDSMGEFSHEQIVGAATTAKESGDIESLGSLIDQLLAREKELSQRLDAIEEGSPSKSGVVGEKRERLDEIVHGMTEVNERMGLEYVMSPELATVVDALDVLSETGTTNVVIMEGEPGTGKTQLPYSLAGEALKAGEDAVLVHVRVKDTMTAQELLYTIDHIKRLSDANADAQLPEKVRAEAAEWQAKIVGGEVNPSDDAFVAFESRLDSIVKLGKASKDLDYRHYIKLGPLGEAIQQSGSRDKVFLVIDEIEKGREELMTGILDELEHQEFRIPEVGSSGEQIKGDKSKLRVFVTTNTEDSDKIPPSFRRRGLYYFMPHHSKEVMTEIISNRFPDLRGELVDYALDVMTTMRGATELEKPPSLPELLAWLEVISREEDGDIPEGIPHQEILLKYQEDRGVIREIVPDADEEMGVVKAIETAIAGGYKVVRLSPEIDDPKRNIDGEFTPIFASLQNEGVNFSTPVVDKNEDGYGYSDPKLRRPFMVLHPGVEMLGDGWYAMDEEFMQQIKQVGQEHAFSIIGQELLVLDEALPFSEVLHKASDNRVLGKVRYQDRDVDAMFFDGSMVLLINPEDFEEDIFETE